MAKGMFKKIQITEVLQDIKLLPLQGFGPEAKT